MVRGRRSKLPCQPYFPSGTELHAVLNQISIEPCANHNLSPPAKSERQCKLALAQKTFLLKLRLALLGQRCSQAVQELVPVETGPLLLSIIRLAKVTHFFRFRMPNQPESLSGSSRTLRLTKPQRSSLGGSHLQGSPIHRWSQESTLPKPHIEV